MPSIDIDFVRDAAKTRWPEIVSQLGGVDINTLDGKHHACPRCGGKDRFRFFVDETGGAICNQCFNAKNGDGFAVLQWLTGESFKKCLESVAQYLGVEVKTTEKVDPEEHLRFTSFSKVALSRWCDKKKPITEAALLRCGARCAVYRKTYVVVAIPIWGKGFEDPVGWTLFNITGAPLPKYTKDQPPEYVKVKIAYGSKPGLMGPVQELESAKEVWKVEGPTDMLAMYSVGVPPGVVVVTNSSGAKERPAPWIVDLAEKKKVNVLHDCDRPGQDGATFWTDSNGRRRPGWCPALATKADEVRNVILPFPIEDTHGKDLRDFLADGKTYQDLEAIAESSDVLTPDAFEPIEDVDDPHRLARINLERYASKHGGATIRYWRDEWYIWKRDRYTQVKLGELRAKLNLSIKHEFDEAHKTEVADKGSEAKPVRKVTNSLVANVVSATQSLVVLSNKIELGTWIDNESKTKVSRNFISMRNGILDLDALLAGENEVLRPHSPKWFAQVCLPYDFDPDAKCPKWHDFLKFSQENDPQRIDLLQEWAGYLLTNDTGYQKFLMLHGDGSNGKSVYCAAIEALVGTENCSHVALEKFGDRFSKTETLGKLVNIAADCGEIDKMAEGDLKSFTSGDRTFFDRKGISGVHERPTARLMFATNMRPRIADRSSGVWRRMLIVPWRVAVPEKKRVANMDKSHWWEESGELPGMLCWAIQGLYRLQAQGKFTNPDLSKIELEDYQVQSNPVKGFMDECLSTNGETWTPTEDLYSRYRDWCKSNGLTHPISKYVFSKELRRNFPHAERKQRRTSSGQTWGFAGVFINDAY